MKKNLKKILDKLVSEKNTHEGLFKEPDPLQIAKIHANSQDAEFICLLCALFAYGNAKNIVNFLKKLDFSLLKEDEKLIKTSLKGLKYRFQSTKDLIEIFITLRRLRQEESLEALFFKHYEKNQSILASIKAFIDKVQAVNSYRSFGYDFFFGKPFDKQPSSPLKRYNMLLRWLVRKDELDLGLFSRIDKAHLLMPLDTHTHKVSLNLGLMSRKVYDFKAVLELTSTLQSFDPKDPIKYDFALYRLGQSKEYLRLS